jgi:hypothetical protein
MPPASHAGTPVARLDRRRCPLFTHGQRNCSSPRWDRFENAWFCSIAPCPGASRRVTGRRSVAGRR